MDGVSVANLHEHNWDMDLENQEPAYRKSYSALWRTQAALDSLQHQLYNSLKEQRLKLFLTKFYPRHLSSLTTNQMEK